jgi:hypothetical protein
MRKITNIFQNIYQPVNLSACRNLKASYSLSMGAILMLLLFTFVANAQVNNPTDSLHIPDISASPAVKQMLKQKAALEKDRLYKPHDTDLITGRAINISKVDLDKYFPNGVDLSLSDPQLNSRIEELKREEIYKYLCIISAILLFGFFALRYFKNRSKKKMSFRT